MFAAGSVLVKSGLNRISLMLRRSKVELWSRLLRNDLTRIRQRKGFKPMVYLNLVAGHCQCVVNGI
jgi:hypothetical protein